MPTLHVKCPTASFLSAAAVAALLPLTAFSQIQYGLGLSCNNSLLRGSYAAQMNVDRLNVVLDLNATTPPSSATDAGFGSSSGPASSTALNVSKAKLLGLSRHYFDGNGSIIGAATTTSVTTGSSSLAGTTGTVTQLIQAGSYTVNPDCTVSISLSHAGTTLKFNGVVAAAGDEVLIQESDSVNPGVTGVLLHGPNFCGSDYNNPQSFGFSYNGVLAGSPANGSTAAVPPSLYSNVGLLTLDGAGNFNVTYWENMGGTINRVGTSKAPVYGTYSIDPTSCVVSLSYAKSSPAGPNFNILATAGGLGLFTVSPNKVQPLEGDFVNIGRAVVGTYGVVNQ